jgi:hypothetical protein
MATHAIRTDREGIADFLLPAPEVVGEQRLSMTLALSPGLEPLRELSGEAAAQLDALERAASMSRARFDYRVLSEAREIPTAVLLIERDAAGNVVGTSRASAGVVSALSNTGFQVRSISIDPGAFTDAEPLQVIRQELGTEVQRLIYGTVSIDSFTEEDGVVVRVTGSARVLVLGSDRVVFSADGLQYSRGSSAQAALSAAFRSIGEQLGRKLANGMP